MGMMVCARETEPQPQAGQSDLGLSLLASLHIARATGSWQAKSQAPWRKSGLSQPSQEGEGTDEAQETVYVGGVFST